MQDVRVAAAKPYSVLIERGLIKKCGTLTKTALSLTSVKVCIVTDENVSALYLDDVRAAYEAVGFTVYTHVFLGGEETKELSTVEAILKTLMSAEFTRSDLLVALGGGIVGDVCGFAAACYLRGIKFVQLPTTLLAAVDSSVGGKTGVNFMGLKNQVGAFHQPSLVLCDPETFGTLSDKIFADGMAEVIKYGVLCAPDLIETLGGVFDICDVIARCVSIKADFVAKDERDLGVRQLLNLGHTVGHAIEKCSNYRVSHGQAVAIGMVIAARSAAAAGICHPDVKEELIPLLTYHKLPTATSIPAHELLAAMAHDKKRGGDTISLILPKKMGECGIFKLAIPELASFLKFSEAE